MQRHALAALQKLSLKRKAQTAIIQQGGLQWTVQFLLQHMQYQPGNSPDNSPSPPDRSNNSAAVADTAGPAGQQPSLLHVHGQHADSADNPIAFFMASDIQNNPTNTPPAASSAAAVAAAATVVPAALQPTLSAFMLEYAAALLMNLCLRTAGKAAAQQVTGDLLTVCEPLLASSNDQVSGWV